MDSTAATQRLVGCDVAGCPQLTNVRRASDQDRQDIRDICLRAFSNEENQRVSELAVDLLDGKTDPPTMCLVAESAGKVVGYVAFSPVSLSDEADREGYILAPLGVVPEHQSRGTGSMLVEQGLRSLAYMGVDVVFVYGDPKYYGRFGFDADSASVYSLPYTLQYPFGWQVVALSDRDHPKESVTISVVDSLDHPELW